jgi:hypothetical protein
VGNLKYILFVSFIAGKETDWFAHNARTAAHVARFQLMTLVGGIAPRIAQRIRAPLILGLPRPPQRTIAVAIRPSMSQNPPIQPFGILRSAGYGVRQDDLRYVRLSEPCCRS